MSNVIEFKRDDDNFGLCPVCKRAPMILNVHKQHFAVCHEHKLAWASGWNLMSGWRHEDQKTWDDNRALLETYQPVEPYFWPRRSA